MAGRLKADLLVILWTVHHVKIKSLPYAVTKQKSCILAVSLTGRQLMAGFLDLVSREAPNRIMLVRLAIGDRGQR